MNLIAISLAVLAFLVAFYALIARERKTPHLTNRIYSAVFCVLSGIFLEACATLASGMPRAALHWSAVAILLIGIAWTTLTILIIQNRQVHLRSDKAIRNMRWYRAVKQIVRHLSPAKYEHNKAPMPTKPLLEALAKIPSTLTAALPSAFENATVGSDMNLSVLAAVHASSVNESDSLLIKVASAFLNTGHPVQFVSCIRHPIEFVAQLRKTYDATPGNNWTAVASRLVVVDAFTPHYGFTDSIHDHLKGRLKRDFEVRYLRSHESYAGLHSATSKAFNLIKNKLPGPRIYALVIYEGAHALVDLESREQYRIFVRHVFPSETVWGGMLTAFVEFDIDDADLALLKMYADIFIDDTLPLAETALVPRGEP
jgi:hypothetical protein